MQYFDETPTLLRLRGEGIEENEDYEDDDEQDQLESIQAPRNEDSMILSRRDPNDSRDQEHIGAPLQDETSSQAQVGLQKKKTVSNAFLTSTTESLLVPSTASGRDGSHFGA